jgi:hypothetical protein
MSSSIDHGAELDRAEALRAGMSQTEESYPVGVARALLLEALNQMDKRQYLNALTCVSNANANLLLSFSIVLKGSRG